MGWCHNYPLITTHLGLPHNQAQGWVCWGTRRDKSQPQGVHGPLGDRLAHVKHLGTGKARHGIP